MDRTRRILSTVVIVAATTAHLSAEPRWTMVRTPSLTVIGDQSAGTLRNVAIQIEQFRSVVARLIPNADRPASLPTIVFVFGERKSMQPFVPLYNGKPVDLAGLFVGGPDANVMLFALDGFEEAASVVYHEYAHLLLRNTVRSLPTWLNEGLAEYYSGYRVEGDGKTASIGRALAQHVLLLRERSIPVAELIAVDQSSPLYNEGNKRSIFYAESWALTHYAMTQLPDGAAAVNRYATAIEEGRTLNDAFRDAFGKMPAEFDAPLRAYVRRDSFTARSLTFKERIGVVTPGPPRAMTEGEANAWLGDLQRRAGREHEAEVRIESAVATDRATSMAHTALGLLRLSQQRSSEAIDALRQAADLAPDDFFAQFVYGVSLLRTNVLDSTTVNDLAVGALKRAVALNPDSADAHGWLAAGQMQTEASLPEARSSIERAIRLAPGRSEYSLRWADIRILQGGYDDAKAVLAKIAAFKSDPDAAVGATRRLERLAQYEGTVAAKQAEQREADAAAAFWINPFASNPPATRSPELRTTNARFRLRRVGPGEERVFGILTHVDCSTNDVRFQVRAGDRVVVATAKRIEDVELTQFLDDKNFSFGCGPRPVPDRVYLTWRRDETPVAGRIGLAVSLEFVPKDYTP